MYGLKHQNVINKYKLIYLPIFIGLIALFSVSTSSYYVSKYLLLRQMEEDGINLTTQTIRQIEGNTVSLRIIDALLEEKIRTAGKAVLVTQHNIDDALLKNIQEYANVDELNWYSPEGEILFSSIEGHQGWTAFAGHPLYEFILSDDEELMEDIRLDAITNIPFRYGSIKNEEGYFVQVGVLAENIYALTEKVNYQTLVENLAKEENIHYALIVDTNLQSIADSDIEDVGIIYSDHEEYLEALKGNTTSVEWYYEQIDGNVLEVAAPIIIDNEIIGILGIGLSVENVYASIYLFSIISFLTALIMFLVILWVQNSNIIKPVNQLNQGIEQIDIENNIEYRLSLSKNNAFLGLASSINNILEKTHTYFCQITEAQQELHSSNIEISTAYQQLSASEEELRVQFDEIQLYTEKLEALKQKYEIAIEGTNSAVWEVDMEAETIYFSGGFKNIVGTSMKEKENIRDVLHQFFTEKDKQKLLQEFRSYANREKEEVHLHVKIKDINKNFKWVLLRGKGIYHSNKESFIINGILLDITQIKEQEEYINHFAYHDHLTNLPNRKSFIEKLENVIANKQSGAVMLLDLDNFKGINDTLGHIYGDKVLIKVAEELKNASMENLFVSRFGGDEFLVLVEGEEDIIKIEAYAERIINIFSNMLKVDEDEIHVNASMGITLFPLDSNEVNQLIMNADIAMFSVKNTKKNGYRFFNKDMIDRLNENTKIEKILREAVKKQAFKLVYQPQICTFSGDIVGFEALLRLKDSSISPALFIPVAEETGLIIEIGRWVTRQVIHQMAIWKEKGLGTKPVAINFSAKQLNDSSYIKFLEEQLSEHNMTAEYLDIEITESIFLDRKEETIEFLNKLKALGTKITIDDFGTGYSSLSYLTFLPVDKIKLDKSLNDKFLKLENIQVVNSLVSLAHSLNLEVVAEGIEDMEQYKYLKTGGCNYIQGYLFSKPLEAEEIRNTYNTNFLRKI